MKIANNSKRGAFGILLALAVSMGCVPNAAEPARNVEAGRVNNGAQPLKNSEPEEASRTELSAGHVMGGKVAIGMKNSGMVRPRGDVLNAVARQAANEMEVPLDDRAKFVRDFEWAFNFAWDKSN